MIEAVGNHMEHPVMYLARVTKFLDGLIQEHGVYLFMGFLVVFAVVAARLVAQGRKPLSRIPPATGAVIGDILASPNLSTIADGGRANLIWGKSGRDRNDCPEVLPVPFNDSH